MKKWTAVKYDVSKLLGELHLTRVTVPAGLSLELVIELDDAIFERLRKDAVWGARVQEKANAKALPVLAEIKKKMVDADAKAAKFDGKTAAIFTNDINATIKSKMEAAGKEMVAEVDHYIEDYKRGQKDLLKFRIKSGTKIGINAISIVGAVAATAASHGAFAPAGIVAIARGSIVITQECAKLATTADQIAVLIQGELKILGAFMNKNMENATKMDKAKQSAKEIGLGAISAILGVETPSLKNCQGHIEVHKVDIAKLDSKSHELSAKINEAIAKEEKWEAKLQGAKGVLTPEKFAKVSKKKDQIELVLHKTLEATFKVNDAINRAHARQEKFEKALDAMMKGVPGWVGYVQTAITLGIDIGLAVGGASTAIEQGLGALIAAEIDIGSELLDKV